jgi:hypothetical protein
VHDAYQISQWQGLHTTLGGSAALAPPLFIAVSIQIRRIAQSPIYRAGAWGNTFLIVALVVDAGFILTPQDVTARGYELCLAPLVFISFMAVTIVRVVQAGLHLPWRPFMSIAVNLIGVAAGPSLIIRRGGAMYLVTLGFLATIVWVTWGA